MVKIKSKNPNIKNCKLVVPFDGTITIDSNGEVEVSANAANILVTGTNDWEYSATPVKAKELTEDEVAANGIKAMSLAELIEMATSAGIDKEAYKKFAKNQKVMAAFMITQYNQAKLAGEVEDDEADEETEPTDEETAAE